MAANRDHKETPLEALKHANTALGQNGIFCPLAQDLPLLPWKTITNNEKTHDGRQFSKHVFDLPELLKLLMLHGGDRHPTTRAPLFLSDINTNLVLHNKTLKFFNYHLRKRNLTYQQFLGELGITPELFAHLCKMRFPAPAQPQAEAKAVQNNPADDPMGEPAFMKTLLVICVLLAAYAVFSNVSAKHLVDLISRLPSRLEFFFKSILGPLFRELDLIFDVLIPLLRKAPETIISMLERMTEHPLINAILAIDFKLHLYEIGELISMTTPSQVAQITSGAVIGGGMGSLAVQGFQQGRKRQYTVRDPDHRHSKKLLALAALGILLLGLDAFTDSIGLVSSISSTSFDRALVLIAPLATTLSAMLFGKATRPSFEEQGKLDFEEFKHCGFVYKPSRI